MSFKAVAVRRYCFVATMLTLVLWVAAACEQQPSKNKGPEWVDTKTLNRGPVRREGLTPDQLRRTKEIQQALAEVDPSSLEEWVDGFKRDQDPEREIAVWEQIVRAYQSYCSTKRLTIEQKTDVLRILLVRSQAEEDEALKHLELRTLTTAEAKKVMSFYEGATSPIHVERK